MTKNQRIVKRGARAVEAVLDQEDVEFVAAVKRQKELEKIAVSDNEPSGEHDLGHVVQVAHGDEIFEAINFAKRNRDGQNHGEAGIDGAGYEIRRKDRGMPARNDGDGEVKAPNSVTQKAHRRAAAA